MSAVTIPMLRIRQRRPGGLFAMDWPGAWMPALVAAGVLCCVAGVAGFGGAFGVGWTIVSFAFGLAFLMLGPLQLLRGAWLSVDLTRGWVHWRRRWGNRFLIDSFSPGRLVAVELAQQPGPVPFLAGWAVRLRIDHPRLPRACVAWSLRRSVAERVALALAQDLALPIAGAGAPPAEVAPFRERRSEAPPEIIRTLTPRAERWVLPNMTGLTASGALFLAYGLIWVLWSWSSLAVQWQSAMRGDQRGPGATAALALMVLLAVAGGWLLHAAVVQLAGMQALIRNERGWAVARRLAGRDWGRRRLRLGPGVWIRRVDQPREQSGLWIPDGNNELQIGQGLESETLSWLLHQLAPSRPPEAVGAEARSPVMPIPAPIQHPEENPSPRPRRRTAPTGAAAPAKRAASKAGPSRRAPSPEPPPSKARPAAQKAIPKKAAPKKAAPKKASARKVTRAVPAADPDKSTPPTAPKGGSSRSGRRSAPKCNPPLP